MERDRVLAAVIGARTALEPVVAGVLVPVEQIGVVENKALRVFIW